MAVSRRDASHTIVIVPLSVPNFLAHESQQSSAVAATPATGRIPAPRALALPGAACAVLRFWHLASLDAPTVAAVWSLAFAWIARVRLPLWVLLLQVLVVWTVYVGDRLLDARAGLRRWDRKSAGDLRERHYFHWRHRRVLAPMAAAAACAAAAIVLHWMPPATRARDSVLAAASLAYFTSVHATSIAGQARRIFSKELLVGVLFTVGCALPVAPHVEWRIFAAPLAFLAALAWLNCRAIERWESGGQGIARVAILMAAAGATAAAFVLAVDARAAALLAAGAASALLLAVLDGARRRVSQVTLRAAADLVLLTPALLLILRTVQR